MRVLLDVNVLLDVVLARQPWVVDAVPLLTAVETGRIEGHVAGHTIPTFHYIVAKERDRHVAANAVADLLRIVNVVPVGRADFHQALLLGLNDFEDAVQVAAGLQAGVDYLVTRNEKDFRGAPLDVRSPREVLALLPADPSGR